MWEVFIKCDAVPAHWLLVQNPLSTPEGHAVVPLPDHCPQCGPAAVASMFGTDKKLSWRERRMWKRLERGLGSPPAATDEPPKS